MKTILQALSIPILISLAACQLMVPPASDSGYPVEEGKSVSPFVVDWDDRQLFSSGLVESYQEVLEQLPGASIYHTDLAIQDDLLRITGRLEVRYTNEEDDSLSEVIFRLYPNLFGGGVSVSSVQVDGAAVTPELSGLNSVMLVPLSGSLAPGEQVVIGFDFNLDITQDMAGNYGLFGYFEGMLSLMAFHPIVAAYDEGGWNDEIPAQNGDVSYADSAFYLVRVSAPAGLTLVASGVQVSRAATGERQHVTFAAGPIRDFYLVASDRFIVESKTVGETTINSYVFEGLEQGAEQSLVYAEGAFDSFNARFALYPYAEFDMVSTPMMALGMEYPGIVANLDTLYDSNESVYGAPAWVILESVVAHEVGHQWFYNLVGNDQMSEPWLDEALTQYITGLYFEDSGGADAWRGFRQSWYDRWDRVDQADIPIGMPVASYDDVEYGAIVYGRGPLFVEALAIEMGEAAFDDFLRDYVERYSWQIATGEGFRQLAESYCGCDLTELFEAWVYE